MHIPLHRPKFESYEWALISVSSSRNNWSWNSKHDFTPTTESTKYYGFANWILVMLYKSRQAYCNTCTGFIETLNSIEHSAFSRSLVIIKCTCILQTAVCYCFDLEWAPKRPICWRYSNYPVVNWNEVKPLKDQV